MFLGHHAAAFAAKRLAPRTSLGTLIAAATLLDLLWPILLLAGLERVVISPGITAFNDLDFTHYPITHSLAAVVLWSIGFGLAYQVRARYPRGAVVAGVAVLSHWVLDWITHRPDLPLTPGGAKVGLNLWQSVPLTIAVELVLLAIGVGIYVRTTRAKDRTGTIALVALLLFVVLIFAGDALSATPPPHWRMVAIGALAAWLFVPWAAWIDRHREARG
jgi:cell shape-determining protein MreD